MLEIISEDRVRQRASKILSLDNQYSNAISGTGQLTTFNQLGFRGISDAPDGWYLPYNKQNVAIILETKNSNTKLSDGPIAELKKNIKITQAKYKNIVGILYNGNDLKVFKNLNELPNQTELQNINYYLNLFNVNHINTNKIFTLTKKINDSLKYNFGIENLYHRMIFTACALVAKRYDAVMVNGMNYSEFHNAIYNTISKALNKSVHQNQKLNLLLDVFSEIKMNLNVDDEDEKQQQRVKMFITDFMGWVTEISDSINSDYWNGEDVMGIFFNEFNRYKSKPEQGQVFTPEHITDFMYRLIDVNSHDKLLDATCGSGGFLVKAMANMIHESGGMHTTLAKNIKSNQLYGIEFDRQIYALACANMLIHKDGKTNLEQMDARSENAGDWIKKQGITKVLMNPPYENKNGCIDIVKNVLNSVPSNTICAFILPDKKLEKVSSSSSIFQNHTLEKIIKLPEKLFFGIGITTSIFVFKTGSPQYNKEIFACYIPDDGLETVKNQGRQDVKNKWHSIEKYWLDIINKRTGSKSIQWLDPNKHWSYQVPIPKFTVENKDFNSTILNYSCYQNSIDVKNVKNNLANHLMYGTDLNDFSKDVMNLSSKINSQVPVNYKNWSQLPLTSLFKITGSKTTPKKYLDLDNGGPHPYVTTSGSNNGVYGYSTIKTEKGDIITIDSATTGSAFYQPDDFSASDHVEKLIPKFNMTPEIALFITTILNINAKRYRYGYDEKRSQSALKKEYINLPTFNNDDKTPDLKFMNEFIHNMVYTSLIP